MSWLSQQGKWKGKFLSSSIVKTFAVHFHFSKLVKVLKNVSFSHPISGLMLAIAAVSDGHTYNMSTLILFQLEQALKLY